MNIDFDTRLATVLIVDDDEAARRLVATVLRSARYSVAEADSVKSALEHLAGTQVSVVLTDLRLGAESGMEVVKAVQQFPDTETILMTAYASIDNAVDAIKAGAFYYLTKPFSNEELLIKVQKAVEHRIMRQELSLLRQHIAMSYGFDNIVGISKRMTQLKETAVRVAPTDITVLITGPSGTGKELFARAIHHHSNRRAARFVAVDCSAIPESLLESELFGHIKGSFTSAWQTKKGLLEEADGGTFFLDEVSNMTPPTQVKLLRFLQDSEIRPVGALAPRKVNVRIVAATNRDLRTMVSEGTFREDLYYRLNVIPINLPPLVERAEDIEILTQYFIRKMAAEADSKPVTITRRAVDKLLSHSWPGNVRELENTLKRGAALCTNQTIDADDITLISGDRPATVPIQPPAQVSVTVKGGLLDSGQRTLIIKTLTDNNWNFTKTAAELGIGRTTLWRKVRKYNLTKTETSEC